MTAPDLVRAIDALPASVRDTMAGAFLGQCRQASQRGDRAAADLFREVGALLLGGNLDRAVRRLGPEGRQAFARSVAEARDRAVGGPSGWPLLGEMPPEAAAVGAVFHELAVLLAEASCATPMTDE